MASERTTQYEKIKAAASWRGAGDSSNWWSKNPYTKRTDLARVWEEAFNEAIYARLHYLEHGDDNEESQP